MEIAEPWTPLERFFKERMAVGEALLTRLVDAEDFSEASDAISDIAADMGAQSFVAELEEDVREIELLNILTYPRGIAFFLLHPYRLLGNISPLEAGVIGQHDLVREAARCFTHSERGFDPRLLDKAIETADKARRYIGWTPPPR